MPGDDPDLITHAEAILAIGRIQGGAAALNAFVALRDAIGLSVLDVDLAAGRGPGQDFFTVTYIRQGLEALGHLENAFAAQVQGNNEAAITHTKKAAAANIEHVRELFAAYQERKKTTP